MGIKKQDQKMTFGQHLGELSKRLVWACILAVVFFVVAYIFAPEMISWMTKINTQYEFAVTDPTELLAQYIKVSLIVALVVDSPFIIWQVHSFVSPGLTKSEDTKFVLILVGGLVFFAIGDVFCYFVVIPFTLEFFYNQGVGLQQIAQLTQLIDLKNYIAYITALLLAFGVIFEMPVITAILASIGLLKPKGMKAARDWVIVLCFVIGAAITPTDVMSQLLVAIPMVILYQLSIWICEIIYKRKRKKLIEEGVDPDEFEEEEEAEKKKESRWASAAAQVEMADARKGTKR